jgi:hypothetical protein
MEECVIEDNQVHLLCRVFLVELFESLVASLSDRSNVWASFVNKWCLSNQFIKLIELVVSLEVSEEIISHELLIFITK